MGGWNIVYALINFAILAFVLVKFGKKMVVNMIQGNRQQISDALDAAKAAGENAQHITETLEDIRAEGQAQSQEIVSQARERSAQSLSQSAQARQELAESRRKQARQDALSMKRQRLGQLRLCHGQKMCIFMNISMLLHGYEISQTDCFATVWLYPYL